MSDIDKESAKESSDAAKRILQREALNIDPLGPLQRGQHEFIAGPEPCVRTFSFPIIQEAVIPDPKITISIPVIIGGYTGQRDDWEEHTYDMKVTTDGETLTLSQTSGTPGRQVRIPWDTLKKAVEMVKPPAPQSPVFRNTD